MKVLFQFEEDSTEFEIDMAVYAPMSIDDVKDSIVNRGMTEKEQRSTIQRVTAIASEIPLNQQISV